MEETRELAVVSEAEVDNDFLIENEMAITFHVRKIADYVSDFNFAHDQLIDLREVDVSSQRQRDEVWDSVELAAASAWKLAQTFLPETRGNKNSKKNTFIRRRGEQLRALFAITIKDKKVIGSFRNRIVHIDEDFDEWFVDSSNDRQVVWRKLANGISPLSSNSYGVAQWYDYGWGVLHSFGNRFSIRAFKNGISLIEERLPVVEKILDDLIPNRTQVLFEGPY